MSPASEAGAPGEAPAGAFPWRVAALGSALLLLSLFTVSLRGANVVVGRELMLLQMRRASLERRVQELQLRLEHRRHGLSEPRPAVRS